MKKYKAYIYVIIVAFIIGLVARKYLLVASEPTIEGVTIK